MPGLRSKGSTPHGAPALRELWALARKGHEDRLCAEPFAGDQGPNPGCIDLAAFPALAGDHSCSPSDLLDSVLGEEWVLDVARVCSRLEAKLAKARTGADRVNATRGSDLELERVDKEYSSRAGANNAHFLLTRDGSDPSAYIRATVRPGAELNAIGIWGFSHLVALRLAGRLHEPGLAEAERADLALRALAVEWYGVHFLQDAFASGHVAGTWGDTALRKGTHDYYNVHGLGTATWKGKAVVLTGDTWMRPQDRDLAAPVARRSLEQLLDALDPASPLARSVETVEIPDSVMTSGVETCRATALPPLGGSAPPELVEALASILLETPVPGLGEGLARQIHQSPVGVKCNESEADWRAVRIRAVLSFRSCQDQMDVEVFGHRHLRFSRELPELNRAVSDNAASLYSARRNFHYKEQHRSVSRIVVRASFDLPRLIGASAACDRAPGSRLLITHKPYTIGGPCIRRRCLHLLDESRSLES